MNNKEEKNTDLTKRQHGNINEQLKNIPTPYSYIIPDICNNKNTQKSIKRGEQHPERKRGEEAGGFGRSTL